ncbi:RNA polymerase sigma factor [Fulvivirga sp. M361]|uniref:RNA polymerase sigma factor n=1 Tax=Fulvivirga sp. M361 TaxID=2594266 RepID=UPI0016266074|nr:sigma-70 family RNA polymerase sigma factor [Fulvivirga sp. M361]
MTDLELIQLCKKGDRKGQRLLFEKYCSAMTRMCYRYIKDESETMLVLNEGFLKIYRNIAQFEYRGEGGLTAWVKKVMLNEALGYLRKRKPLHVSSLDESSDLSWDYIALENLEAEYIFQAILSLPEGYRAVFNLSVIEGFSHKEIAEKLGIAESTSRSQLVQAKRRLQSILIKEICR